MGPAEKGECNAIGSVRLALSVDGGFALSWSEERLFGAVVMLNAARMEMVPSCCHLVLSTRAIVFRVTSLTLTDPR